ncbi:hypothetical protein JW921_06825 [Candidatus Fermentibacterales bacterium]|nr:hypothetical protein [Candidatus Fermentibacterales bacterium]
MQLVLVLVIALPGFAGDPREGERTGLLSEHLSTLSGDEPQGLWRRFSVYIEGNPVRRSPAVLFLSRDGFVLALPVDLVAGEAAFGSGDPRSVTLSPDEDPEDTPAHDLALGDLVYDYEISAGGRVLSLYSTDPRSGVVARELYERLEPSGLEAAGLEASALEEFLTLALNAAGAP